MTMTVERALQAINGIARTMRTRPALSSLRAQSFAIEDAVKVFEAALADLPDLCRRAEAYDDLMRDRECSCLHPSAGGDGPEPDCDVHGLPSAAASAAAEDVWNQAQGEARALGTIRGVPVVLPDDAVAHREVALVDDTTEDRAGKTPRDIELGRILVGMHDPSFAEMTAQRIAQVRADARTGTGTSQGATATRSPTRAEQVAGVPLTAPEVSGQGVKVRNDARDTARAAALAALPTAGQNRRRVLDAIAGSGVHLPGMTDREIAEATGLPENSVRPRRVELVEGGWIEDSGGRRDHGGRTPWAVWKLTDKGRSQYGL